MVQVQRTDLTHGSGTRTGLPAPLVGGLRLNSIEMPVCAVDRLNASLSTAVELSYSMARGCAKLLDGEIGSVELVGSASEASASGIHIVLGNGTSRAWVVAEDSPSGTGKILKLCGMPFSSQLVNYNAGLVIGLFLLQNRESYIDYTASVEKAVGAWHGENELLKAQSLALMADELAFAVEQMIDGCDPLGIKCVLMDREQPVDIEQVFDGGDKLKEAFTCVEALRRLVGNPEEPSIHCAVADAPSPVITFMGDLPTKLEDCIKRGKHVLLTGPTATGKTLCVEEVCLQLGAPLTIIRGSEGLEDRDFIASVSLVEGSTVTQYGPIPEAMLLGRRQYELHVKEIQAARVEGREPLYTPPSVLLIDEINRLQLRHQNFLVSAMNVRKASHDYYLRVPDTNEEITCPDGFLVIVAARNIGNAFVGTNSMDLALERRFYKKIDLQYLQLEQEASLVQAKTGLDESLTKVLVKVASDTRYQLSQLKAPLDTDTVLKWAEELVWLKSAGADATDQLLLDTARDVVFDLVLERSERGGFDQAGEAILTDNISENWRDTFAS